MFKSLLLLIVVGITGCAFSSKPVLINHKSQLESIKSSTELVKDIQSSVDTECDSIIKESPSDNIIGSVVVIRKDMDRLDVVTTTLDQSNIIVNQNLELENLNNDLIKARDSKQDYIWVGMLAVSASMMAISIGLIAFGLAKIGVPLLITGIVSAALSKAMVDYGKWVSIIGIAIIIGVILYFLYKAYNERKALVEVVGSVQAVRSSSLDGLGFKQSKGIVDIIQSESTKEIVRDIKENIINK